MQVSDRNKLPFAYDVAVAYRIYPRVSKVPFIFSNDKFRLATLCLKSFRMSLGKLRAKMYVLLDGCPSEYQAMFREYFKNEDLKFIELENAGNSATFIRQLEILTDQDDAPFVYLAEDDYLYLPDQFSAMLELLKSNPEVDFVSPYDHPDFYSLALADYPVRLHVSVAKHWRVSGTTCMTFLTTRENLARTKHVFATYARRNYDSSIWLSLTKHCVWNPLLLVKFAATRKTQMLKVIVKAWVFCWRQILFGRRWSLWTPVPSIATHVEGDFLAPGVDWLSVATTCLKTEIPLQGTNT